MNRWITCFGDSYTHATNKLSTGYPPIYVKSNHNEHVYFALVTDDGR